MTTFVQVHGGYGGGWDSKGVACKLSAAGHEVYRPTLTGSGERVHLASPNIDLNTHITDIVNVLHYEDLHNVVLVGMSYGGAVITGVAEQIPERIEQMVFVDGFMLEDGECIAEIYGQETVVQATELLRSTNGWRLPIDQIVDDRNTDILVKVALQPLQIKNPIAACLRHTYVLCTAKPPGDSNEFVMSKCAERAKDKGWNYRELPTAHYPALTDPEKLADLQLELIDH